MSSDHEKGVRSLFSVNERAAQALTEIAEYLELAGENRFKIRAYVKAASALRQLDGDLEELSESRALESVPGVGKAIAEKLEHFLTQGTIPLLEELRAQIPAGLVAVASLSGLGPKKTALLHAELGVDGLPSLREALRDGRVAQLKGFTAKGAARLLDEVEKTLAALPTYLKDQVEEWSEQMAQRLRGLPGLFEVQATGAVRSRTPTPTRLDLLLISRAPQETLAALSAQLSEEGLTALEVELDWQGRAVSQWVLEHPSGCPVGLTVVPQELAAWAQLTLTGPATFVDWVLERLGGELWEGCDETELLDSLRRGGLLPEIRHRPSCWNEPPTRLLSTVALQGNLHAHTTDSDGRATLEEMVAEARRRGHSYFGCTDHSRSLVIANGLTIERLLQQNESIRRLNRGWGDFVVFSGVECDILEDGELDYPPSVLDSLDYVVAAVHSFFHLDPPTMTQRLLRGLQGHPKVKILAHPTGRLLTRRQGYSADWEAVFACCAERRIAVEINANPWRLDLSEELLDRAIEAGCLVAINTDAHSLGEFDHHHHGVDMARRGAVPPERVVNTWSAERLQEWFADVPL